MASGHAIVPHKQAEHMAAPTSFASTSKKPLPTGSRPHMASNGHPAQHRQFPLLTQSGLAAAHPVYKIR